jgi:uncharacterized protein
MKICICGGSGFIGNSLCQAFKDLNYSVTVISRMDFVNNTLLDKLRDQEVLINLAGESINRRWTVRNKRLIYNSRISTTKLLVSAINSLERPLGLFINISAVGVYDSVHIHNEDSRNYANGFLSKVVQDWEEKLKGIREQYPRIVILRLGIVLHPTGGMLKTIRKPYSFRIGFNFHMQKGFAVIHLWDLTRIIKFILDRKEISGVVNAVAPFNCDIKSFFVGLNRRWNPVLVFPLYEVLLKLILGESAAMITSGQFVLPDVLIRNGFIFIYDDMEKLLNDLVDLKNY